MADKADGFKVTLGVNTTLIVAGIVAGVGLYFQVQAQETRIKEHETETGNIPARVIVLEQKLNNIERTVNRNEEKLDDIQNVQEDILDAVTDD